MKCWYIPFKILFINPLSEFETNVNPNIASEKLHDNANNCKVIKNTIMVKNFITIYQKIVYMFLIDNTI